MVAYSHSSTPIPIYYSCARKDYALQKKLDQQLSGLRRGGTITTSYPGQLQGGDQADARIASYLEQAQIIVLLLSPDYLDDDRCYAEMERAIQRRQAGDCHVLPVLLRPLPDWKNTKAGHLQPLPTTERAVTLWINRDEAFANVADGIIHRVELIGQQRQRLQADTRRLRDLPPSPLHKRILPRDATVQACYQTLIEPDTSALALTGLAGIGKSMLASQVYSYAEHQRQLGAGPFTHEALWIRIRSTTTFTELVRRIEEARAQFPQDIEKPSPQDLAIELFNTINQPAVCQLIVLDQFDEWLSEQHGQLTTKNEALQEWLMLLNDYGCTSRILITSRFSVQGQSSQQRMYLQEKPLAGLANEEGIALLRLWGYQEQESELRSVLERCKGHLQALVFLDNSLRLRHISMATLFDDPIYRQLWSEEVWRKLFDDTYHRLSKIQRALFLSFSIYREAVSWQAIHAVMPSFVTSRDVIIAIDALLSYNFLYIQREERYELHPFVAELTRLYMEELEKQDPAINRLLAHAAAAHYYQQLSATARPTASLDELHIQIEATWHLLRAEQWQAGYAQIQCTGLFTDLLYRSEYGILLELYTLLLPSASWQPEVEIAATIYNEMGEIKSESGQKQEARSYFEKALACAREAGMAVQEVKALNNIGSVQRSLGQIEQALEQYLAAMNIIEATPEHVQRGITFNNLGRAMQDLAQSEHMLKRKDERYRQALEYYERAMIAHQEVNDSAETARTQNNIGEVYHALQQWEAALSHYRQALQIFREIRARRGEGIVCNNLGALYRKLGQKQHAFEYYTQALRIFREIKDYWDEAQALKNLGRLYLFTQQNEVALACFLLARDIYTELHTPEKGTIIPGLQIFLSGKQDLEQTIAIVQPQAASLLEAAIQRGI